MKIKDSNFLKGISNYLKYKCFLFYGPNTGKINDLETYLRKKLNCTSNLIIDNDDLKKDGDYLTNYMKSFDIFADSKLVIFNAYNSDTILRTIEFSDDKTFDNCKLIIKAGELSTKSKLRNIFEKNKNLISIPCYEDTVLECKDLIEKKLLKEGLSLQNEQILFLSKSLSRNRFLINCEIEKIVLYLKQNQTISNQSLRKLVNTDTKLELESLIYAVVSGKILEFEALLNRAKKNGVNEVTILNALTRHFCKILYAKQYFLKTNSYIKSVKSIFPPIFFKLEEEFIHQTKIWPKSRIESLLEKLLDIQIKLKNRQNKSESLLRFILLSIIKISRSIGTKVT